MAIPFTKMHGAGNDYVYVDGSRVRLADPAEFARRVSDRHKGIGSDGLILIQPSEVADCRMEMYNADGSRGQMCGNGIRCVAKYVYDRGLARRNPLRIETDAGIRVVEVETRDGRVVRARVDMGEPVLEPTRIPVRLSGERIVEVPLRVAGRTWPITCVSMGNPHCVVFVDDPGGLDLRAIGPEFERHEIFPQRANVEFVRVVSPEEIQVRVWERGSGETQACGTGACAAAVAGVLTGRTSRRVVVRLPGGDLEVEWRAEDGRVWLRGEAVEVFHGEI